MSGQASRGRNVFRAGKHGQYQKSLPPPSGGNGGNKQKYNFNSGGSSGGGGGGQSRFNSMGNQFNFNMNLFGGSNSNTGYSQPHIVNDCLREIAEGYLSKAFAERWKSEAESGGPNAEKNMEVNGGRIDKEVLGHLNTPCQKAGIKLWEFEDQFWDMIEPILGTDYSVDRLVRLVAMQKANEEGERGQQQRNTE